MFAIIVNRFETKIQFSKMFENLLNLSFFPSFSVCWNSVVRKRSEEIRRKKPCLYLFSLTPSRPPLFPSRSPSSTSPQNPTFLCILLHCTEAMRTVPRPPKAQWDGCHVLRLKRIYFPEHFCYYFSSNLCVLNATNTD
jgi:hypothetical protein